MSYINIIQLLFRIIDIMIEMKKEVNMFKHDNLLILFLHIQLLIIVVYIYPLILSDMNTVKVISYILGSWSTNYIFTLAEFDIPCIKPIAAESEHSQSRYSFLEVVHLYSNNISIRGLLSISIREPEEGFEGHFSKPSTKSYRRQACKATFILLD